MARRLARGAVAAVALVLCVAWAAAQKVPSKAEQGFDENGKVVDLKKWFGTLPVRLNKEKAKGFTALYDFTIPGPNGGRWWVRVKDQKSWVSTKQPKDKVSCTVTISDENWLKIINGEMKAMWAYVTRKLRVGGNKDQANKFGDIFF